VATETHAAKVATIAGTTLRLGNGDRQMLRHILTTVLITLLLLLFIEWASSIFVHPCPQGAAANQCPYESGIIVEGMKVFASWRPEVWTAIGILTIAAFAAILGVFSISLAHSAQIAAGAARLASQVAVGAERAHLFVHIETENIVSTISQASKGAASPKERPPALRLSYALKNHGETPAMIRELSHGVVVASDLPENQKYQAVSQLPVDILGAGEKTPPIQVVDLPRLTSNDITSIEELFNSVWFYGVVVYDDIFGWRRTLEFVLQYSTVLHGLRVFRYQESEVRRPDPKAKARGRFGDRIFKKSRPSPK
jgi:hypothetical protein